MTATRQAAFWNLAADYLVSNDVDEGTLMGTPCLRLSGDFLATIHRKTGDLIVKLNAERTAELIEEGIGVAFAPAGRTFTEWVAIPTDDVDVWRAVLDEALRLRRSAL